MEKDFVDYNAIDFAKNPDFLKWVKYADQYPDIKKFWEEWCKAHPFKKDEIEEARQLIVAILEEKYLPTDDQQREVWSRVLQTLEEDNTLQEQDHDTKTRVLWKSWMAKAAAIAGIALVSFIFYKQTSENTYQNVIASADSIQEEKNDTEKPKTVVLSDGTSIILQPNSSIRHPKEFKNDLREVYLSGEAFFEVKKDPARPFLVYANEIVTRVLGTSFTIRNFNKENVIVKVKTGKVSVFKEKDSSAIKKGITEIVDGVVLTPNQQVVYERDQMKLTKSLIENPTVLVPVGKEDFEFRDTPIAEVFSAIERAYGVDIVYDEESLSACFLNASLSDAPLHDKLKLICKGINATYEMMDSHIIIYGQGCH